MLCSASASQLELQPHVSFYDCGRHPLSSWFGIVLYCITGSQGLLTIPAVLARLRPVGTAQNRLKHIPSLSVKEAYLHSYGAYPEGQASMHSERLRGVECGSHRGGTPISLCLATAHPEGELRWPVEHTLWPHSTTYLITLKAATLPPGLHQPESKCWLISSSWDTDGLANTQALEAIKKQIRLLGQL